MQWTDDTEADRVCRIASEPPLARWYHRVIMIPELVVTCQSSRTTTLCSVVIEVATFDNQGGMELWVFGKR